MALQETNNFTKKFLEEINKKNIHVVSHFDTDGITSAAILSKTLERLHKQFSIKIIKQLNEEEINALPKDRIIILLDLGSNSLTPLSKLKNKIFIIDHHQISKKEIPKNISMINPFLFEKYDELSGSELVYLISRTISENNKDLAYLAILGMIGDTLEKNISKIKNTIIKDSQVKIKEGLLLYPSTRPIDKTIQFSSKPFIPGATGDYAGAIELLKEAGIEKTGKTYKPLIDLNKEEMKNLTTAVMLRLSSKEKKQEYIGNLYLIKFFNRIEDARELSAMINACSRMDHSEIAFLMCMGNSNARKEAEKIYIKYRQHIISGLKFIDKNHKITGREYIIINAKDNIKDTIIGTMASILSFSSVYKQGTIIIAMAYNEDRIKVSTRMAGRDPQSNRNLKELMDYITQIIGGESGGHKHAAGCTIKKEHENEFINLIKKKLDVEVVKV